MKKRGYFFTLDVIIALVIMVVGFILVWSTFISGPEQRQPFFYAQSLIDFMATSTNIDVSTNDYVQELIFDGTIDDLDRTVLEQIALFHQEAQSDPAKKDILNAYVKNISHDLVAEQYSFEILFDKNIMYHEDGLYNKTQNQSDVLISAKKLVVVVIDKTDLSPPYLAEVKVWQ